MAKKTKQEKRQETRQKEQASALAFHDELQTLCNKYKEGLSSFDANIAVSSIMLAFDHQSRGRVDYQVGNYGVEGAMDTYMARKVEEHIPRIEKLYQFLVDNKYLEGQGWEYTEDGSAFYIPAEEGRRILCVGRRSANYLIFLEDVFSYKLNKKGEIADSFEKEQKTAIHIRQVYDSVDDYYDKDNLNKELQKEGLPLAVKRLDALSELSDNVDEYPYVRRPDLSWYKAKDFALQYSDGRDGGYILSLGHLGCMDKLDQCLGNYYRIKNAFFWINLCIDEIDCTEENS